MRTRNRALAITAGILATLLLATAVALANLHWFRAPLERAIADATGRETHLRGALRVWPLLPPRLVVGEASLGNADWASGDEPLFAVQRLEVRPYFWRLVRGQLAFRSIEADGLRVNLERDERGRANWQLRPTEDVAADDAPASPLLIRRLVLRDSRLGLREPSLQTELTLAASTEDAPRPTHNRLRLAGDGRYRDAPFSLDARVDVPARIDADDLAVELSADAAAGATRLHAAGTLPAAITTLGAELDLQLRGDSLGDLFPLTGIALPETPPYDLSGRVGWRDRRIEWQGFKGKVGDSELAGDVVLELGRQRPRLEATLQSALLDFDDLGALFGIPPASGEGETASPEQQKRKAQLEAKGRVLPSSELSFAKLNALDADVTLKAARIQAPKLPLRTLEAHVQLENGVLQVDPLDFEAAGGALETSLRIDAREQPLQYRLEAGIKRLKLAELVPKAESLRDAVGRIDGHVRMQGRGDSVAAMFASADGEMQAIVGPGQVSNLLLELAGLDVAEALKFLVGKDRKVAIRCAYADFRIEQGIARAEALALDTADTALLGRGELDLREERFDLTLLPRPKDSSPISLRSPLRIGGTFLDPSFGPQAGPLVLRGAAVVALAALAPPAALLGLLETGPGEDVSCGPGQKAPEPGEEERREPRERRPAGPRPANEPPAS